MLPKIQKAAEQIQERRETILGIIEAAPPEMIWQRPSSDSWSMLEVAEHVMLLEKAVLRPVKVHIEQGIRGSKIGIGSMMRTRLLGVAFTLHLPLETPLKLQAQTQPTGKLDFGHLLLQWEEEWQDWIEILEDVTPESIGYPVFEHPVAGQMDILHTLYLLRAHMDNHLHQLRTLQRKINRGQVASRG